MHINTYKLHAKGMHPKEIEKVKEIIHLAQSKKSASRILFEKSLYWILLGIAILGNLLVSIYLIPFIILFSNINLYIILIIMGATFGILFTTLIRDIELQLHNHTLILFVVPIIAFVNFFIITTLANATALTYQLPTHNPALVGILYATAFLLPYINFLVFTFIRTEKV